MFTQPCTDLKLQAMLKAVVRRTDRQTDRWTDIKQYVPNHSIPWVIKTVFWNARYKDSRLDK